MTRCGFLAGILVSTLALADAPVIVVDARVPQFREAAQAAKGQLPQAVEVSPTAPDLAARLQAASVIVAVGQQAFVAAQKAAPGKPLVFCMVLGAVGAATATVTGVPMENDPRVMLRQIRALSPSAKRVGIIYDGNTGEALVKLAREAAPPLGLEIVAAAVGGPEQVKPILNSVAGRIDVLWLPPDPRLFNREVFSWVLGLTSERKLPLYGFLDSFTEAGALASVSPDYADIGLRAGKLAATIAARAEGQRTPVPAPDFSPGKLTINLRTARALGLDVPQQALSQARQVYK